MKRVKINNLTYILCLLIISIMLSIHVISVHATTHSYINHTESTTQTTCIENLSTTPTLSQSEAAGTIDNLETEHLLETAAASHTVRGGDTMWKIAVRYEVGLSELIQANPQIKNPALIYVGQIINIPNAAPLSSLEDEVIRLVNIQRANNGLQLLTKNWEASRVARYKSQDMINKGYFAHMSPTYGSPFQMMENFGLRFSAAAENIAYGQRTAAQVMNSWMNSPGHRANILNRSFTQIGAGAAKAANGTLYWTQMFLKPIGY